MRWRCYHRSARRRDDASLPSRDPRAMRRQAMFEHRGAPLLSPSRFARRFIGFAALSLAIVAGALALGTAGYHAFAGLPWIDALLNAAMILSGMGPVNPMETPPRSSSRRPTRSSAGSPSSPRWPCSSHPSSTASSTTSTWSSRKTRTRRAKSARTCEAHDAGCEDATTASSSARAFHSVSRHSRAGSLSATMPPPVWTRARPPDKRMLRITTARSQPPRRSR